MALFITLLCRMTVSTSLPCCWSAWPTGRFAGLPALMPFITAIGASFFLQYTMAGLFGTR